MSAARILIFDSGVGGLSVAQCIHHALPSAHLTYLADNACFPYGDQPESVVVSRCCSLIEKTLASYPADIIVVACNTASTVVLPHLRSMTDIPVVGVVPAIKPAASVSKNRRIGLLATPATVRRPYLDQLVEEFAADCTLTRIGHPELVRWIEDWVAGNPLPLDDLKSALADFQTSGVDTVVLGCTHYPLIADQLRKVLPGVHHWVDSGEAIARRTAFLLQQAGHPLSLGKAGEPVMGVMLFSGPVPSGIDQFMAQKGMAPAAICAGWPTAPAATAAGSV